MNNAKGIVFKFGDNVDTDVIIPARYLNSSDPAELATHCMEDIDKDFIKNVKKGDIIKISDNSEVQNFGYAIKTKKGAQGVLVTSVLVVDGAPVNTSVAFVPGELAIKSKKGHGIITTPKSKKEKDTDEEVDEEETSEENED